ncbi:MAG: fimbria major subunit [Muribaculaceae bacterium]|nr:fimbria major subunit [Muribaculaceae bacterium]
MSATFSWAALSFSSCKDDMPGDEEQTVTSAPKETYYFTIDIQIPSETASTRGVTESDGTSSDKTQEATAKEKTLMDAEIYFCQNNEVKVKLDAEQLVERTDKSITIFAKLEDIDDLVDMAMKEEDIQLFIVGNVKATKLSHTFDKTGDNANAATFTVPTNAATSPLGDFGKEGQYLPIVNAKKFSFKLPKGEDKTATIDLIKNKFQRGQNGYQYYVIPETLDMERGVARLEYKDLRPDDSATDVKLRKEHVFKVEKFDEIYLRLYSMTPFNVNKKSYLFRHAAKGDNSKATGISELLEYEKGDTGYNWITNPDWTLSSGVYTKLGSFFNGLEITEDSYDLAARDGEIRIDQLDGRTNGSDDGFHPWCYITENTLPSIALMEEFEEQAPGTEDELKTAILTKHATGIKFKFILLDKNGDILQYEDPNETGGDNGTGAAPKTSLYPKEVSNSNTEGSDRWISIMHSETGEYMDVKPEKVTVIGEDGKEKEVTAYCLEYIACIIHNGQNYNKATGPIPPMYYGVVRNNTYQIGINSIDYIPFPERPQAHYLSVEIKVLPWVRRSITVAW